MHTTPGPPPPSPVRQSFPARLGLMLLALFALVLLTLLISTEYLLHNAEPILSKRITDTLSARFGAPVTLDALGISLLRGLQVEGTGLRIGYPAGAPQPEQPAEPMIAVEHFRFRTNLLTLLRESLQRQPVHVDLLRIEGLALHIPAARHPFSNPEDRSPGFENPDLLIGEIDCRDVKLTLDAPQPTPNALPKPPHVFRISTLDLRHVGRHQPMLYDARLLNPKPTGNLHVTGHFGPWAGDKPTDIPLADWNPQPGQTPLDGNYTFDHADLGTIRGLGGTLSSTGHFAGTLDNLTVDGHTDTPDFALGIANHPMPLHTDFHAVVDGTSGDTILQPVHAWLAGSAFTLTGKIVNMRAQGHDIQLQVEIPHGRIQDFLRLAVKTAPPIMNGTLAMRAQVHIPPGTAPVPEKLSLAGNFTLTGVQFTNPRWQGRIDTLSTRAQLSPTNNISAETQSRLSANLNLDRGILGITDLHYTVPGAVALMNGVYSTDGKLFEFRGHVRTEATVSQMVGGWKGLLLSPFDHYLQKTGAGVDLPVEISGTGGDLHFGLALAGADDAPAQLLTDLRAKTATVHELHGARGLAAQAAAEDTAAARAGTLEDAQRHHNNAVRLRAEAQAEAPQPNH